MPTLGPLIPISKRSPRSTTALELNTTPTASRRITSRPSSSWRGCFGSRGADCFPISRRADPQIQFNKASNTAAPRETISRPPLRARLPSATMDDSWRTNVVGDQPTLAPSPARPVVSTAQPGKEHRDQSEQPSSSPNSSQPLLGSVRYSVFPQLRPCQPPSAPGVRAVRSLETLERCRGSLRNGVPVPQSPAKTSAPDRSVELPPKTPTASVGLGKSGNRTTSPSESLVCRPDDPPSPKRAVLKSDIDSNIDIPGPIRNDCHPVASSDIATKNEEPPSPRHVQESSPSTITKERSTQSLSTQTEAAHVLEQHATGIRPSPAFWPAKPLPASPRLSRTSNPDQAQDSAALRTGCRDENQRPGDDEEGGPKGSIINSQGSLLESKKKEKGLDALPVSQREPHNSTLRACPHVVPKDGEPFLEKVKPQASGLYAQQPDDASSDKEWKPGENDPHPNAVMSKAVKTLDHTTNKSAVSEVLSTLRTVGNIPSGREPSQVGLKNKKAGPIGFLSPSQRLHRASVMRRDKIAETERRSQGTTDLTMRSTLTPSPQAPSVESIEEGSWNATELHDGESEIGLHEEDEDINDRDVLRGLMIICAASADTEFDALVRNKTGLRLRRFLADLQSFEGLNGIQ